MASAAAAEEAPAQPPAPLGWLSNILPGGGNDSSGGKGSKQEDIEKCTDVEVLVRGIEDDLSVLLGGAGEEEEAASASAASDTASDAASAVASGGSLDFGDLSIGSGKNDDDNAASDAAAADQASATSPASIPTPQAEPSLPKLTQRETTLAARLFRLKSLLYTEHNDHGKRNTKSKGRGPPIASAAVYSLLKRPGLVPTILKHMTSTIPFEARKDFTSVVSYLFVCGLPDDGIMIGGTTTAPPPAQGDDECIYKLYEAVSSDFARYVEEEFDVIMEPIVRGHDVTDSSIDVGGGEAANTNDAENDNKEESAQRPANNNTRKSSPDVALHCGSILRSALRHARLFKLFVSDTNAPRYVYPFLDKYVHQPNFEVSGDCLETIKMIFLGGVNPAAAQPPQPTGTDQQTDGVEGAAEESTAAIASAFLQSQYAPLIEDRLNNRLLSPQTSYVTKRASIQLLSTVLLTRSNYPIMMEYISSRSNLRTIMLLLRDPSPHVTLDAFHVFKIFVANPQKTREVTKILVDNRVKLVKYLDGLHRDREGVDVQFRDEKKLVIATLEGLELED